MALPQDDPSLPSNPAPLFSDTDAVRGDHQRANNQYIWENFEYLNDGENINDADAATPVDADKLGFWQIVGGIIKYVTFANLFLWIGTKIAALSTKATPVDADSVVIVDSENSNVLKRVLFSALKTFFKAYFDTLYGAPIYYAKLSDAKSAGTAGGSFNSGAWQTRTINTEDSDSGNIVSIASNQFTLAAGTYRILARATAYAVNRHQAKLYNVTDGANVIIGTSEFANQTYTVATASTVAGQFTIAGSKTFEIQHQCSSTRATDGFGLAANFGVSEIYTVVELWKTA